MKRMFFACAAAFLAAVLSISPAAGALQNYSICGDTYTVQPGDSLARISDKCGATVDVILELNPQIANNYVIYSGQILRMSYSAPVIYKAALSNNYYPYYSPASTTYLTNTGYARLGLSTVRAYTGGPITVYVSGFPANAKIDYRIGEQGEEPSTIYDGVVGSDGKDSQTFTIPYEAYTGEYWVIQVLTTSQADGVEVTSPAIYITNYYITGANASGYARINLSRISAGAGDSVTVTLSGFPVNEPIDYRVGKTGEDPVVYYDGVIDANGNASQTITIPASAIEDETWVVHVLTSGMKGGVEVYSHSILITD